MTNTDSISYTDLFDFYKSFDIPMSKLMKKYENKYKKDKHLTEVEKYELIGLLISDWATGRLPIYNKPFSKAMISLVKDFAKAKRELVSNQFSFDDYLELLTNAYDAKE